MHNLYFYEVLDKLVNTKEPLEAKRKAWGNDAYIEKIIEDGKPRIIKHGTTGKCLFTVGYSPLSEDYFANDWIIEYK